MLLENLLILQKIIKLSFVLLNYFDYYSIIIDYNINFKRDIL